MSLVKFVKGDTTSLNSTYRRQGTGNIEFDSTTKKIYLDGVNYTGEVDSELTQSSNNPVSSSALYKVITENELTTAAALTEHENRLDGLDETIAEKQDTLTFDTTPTANSTNPVTSGGIKEYVDGAIDASTPMTEITYSDLVTARNNNNLKPDTWYRITDYTTTTTQADTQSAGHNFDVIVLATSSNTLSEEARAIKHDGDTYFANSNLNAWKVWYSLNNDTTRFAWADEENGKGVIYRLIDEFNNDIKYDFKNIQFKRKLTDGQYDATNGTDTWCYTLNFWYNDMCQDASVVGNTLPNDEGYINYINGVYDNKFGYTTANVFSLEGVNTFAFALGDNVVLSFNNDGAYYGIYSNTIGNYFFSNTIGAGDGFNTNTIGNYFFSNTIGNGFNTNTIGDYFSSNTIGNGFISNTIGNSFNGNTIGNNFYFNTIGNGFNDNTTGNEFYSNTIGDSFYFNTVGNRSNCNTIGNNFRSNTTGNDFSSNTIGNGFNANKIGNSFSANTIGNGFSGNTIGTRNGNTITTIDYVRYIRVEDGVGFVDITTSTTTSNSNWLQNITIAQGVSGTSASTRKVITHPTVNDNFQTIYRSINSQVVTV